MIPGSDPTDEALAKAFQAGDRHAFETLVLRHRQQLLRTCRGILRNAEQADEACQDAFVKAWRGLATFRGESSVKTWLYRIAMNSAYDLRAREATQLRARDEAFREAPRDGAAPGPRALDVVVREQELGLLREAVAKLPDRQRTTLLLKVQQELKYTEIAEVLGCPTGTAKANFHHAVQNLRRILMEMGLVPAAAAPLPLDVAAEEG